MGWLLKDWLGNVCPLASEFQQAYNPRNCPLPQLLGWSSRFNGFRLSRLANSHKQMCSCILQNTADNLWYVSKSTNRIYGSTVEYTRIHYTAWEYCLLFAQPIQASFSDMTGVDPITQIIEEDMISVVEAGHRSAQIGDYKKQEYSSQKQITVKTIVGNPLGNTTTQMTGNGLTYRTIKLRPTSSSVAISLWALARCQLWSTDVWRWVKQSVYACSIFSNHLSQSVHARWAHMVCHVNAYSQAEQQT